MEIGVNYLEEVKELLEDGKIDFIDYLKLYSISGDLSPFVWCASQRKVMFHGMIGKSANILDKNLYEGKDLNLLKEYYKIGKTPHGSMHICIPSNEKHRESTWIEIAKENVDRFKSEFKMDILLENVPYIEFAKDNLFFIKPEFISKVVYETDSKFLFDISHARCAAQRLNMPFEEYVNLLPIDRLVETHLAGCIMDEEGFLVDNHSKMNDEDYEFLRGLVKKSKMLKYVTLEYGTTKTMRYVGKCPTVSYGQINSKAKAEVYEQLTKIKEIIDGLKNKTKKFEH